MVDDIRAHAECLGSARLATFGGTYEGGVGLQQNPDEIARCLHDIIASGMVVNSYLEIGAASGGLTLLVNHYFTPQTIVLVDSNEYDVCKARVDNLNGVRRVEVIGKSDDAELVNFIALATGYFDLVMIDAAHDYASVRMDVDLYLPLVRLGGLLLLHDSALPDLGVQRVVTELKVDKAVEFVQEYVAGEHACGIAVFKRVAW